MVDCCFLKDSNVEESLKFLQIISDKTNLNWSTFHCQDNGKKGFIRTLKVALFSFRIYLKRKKIRKVILSWQQIFGILYAFYCRLLHSKKYNKMIVMTFIYNPSKGLIGAIKYKLINYAVNSIYIDKIIVTTSFEADYYSELFGSNKFKYIPWGIEDDFQEYFGKVDKGYLFSSGRSNRDYKFLFESLKGTEYKMVIACDSLMPDSNPNISIYTSMYGDEMLNTMSSSKIVIIALEDGRIASGQLVFLQAMAMGKPVILTESLGLSRDYAINNYNCIVIKNNKNDLLEAIEKLNKDSIFYNAISNNMRKEFLNKYAIEYLALNIAKEIFNTLN